MELNLKEYGQLLRTVLEVNDTNQKFVISNVNGETTCTLANIYQAKDGLQKQLVIENFSFEDIIIAGNENEIILKIPLDTKQKHRLMTIPRS